MSYGGIIRLIHCLCTTVYVFGFITLVVILLRSDWWESELLRYVIDYDDTSRPVVQKPYVSIDIGLWKFCIANG